MTDVVRLELTDPEAVLRADGRNEGGLTRLQLLRRAAIGGGAVLGGGVLLSGVPAAYAQGVTDVDILNLLHLNEAMEAAFYSEAVSRGRLSGRALEFARQLATNETAHRDLARQALGANARPLPGFAFGETTANNETFLATSLVLENNDVAVLNGGQVVSVEARQAAWIRRILFGPDYEDVANLPAPSPLDEGITPQQARAAILATGFIRGEIPAR
jgi:hypothetical protein